MLRSRLLSLACISMTVSVPACTAAPDEHEPRTATQLPSSSAVTVRSDAARSGWRADVEAELRSLAAEEPDLLQAFATVVPRRTRAGHLRLLDDRLHDARIAAVLLDRLTTGDESPEVRAALVEALPRTGGRFVPAITSLLPTEPSPLVRSAMVATLRRSTDEAAAQAVIGALRDGDVMVREEAARVASTMPRTPALLTALEESLEDAPQVQAAAAWTLGVLEDERVAVRLVPLLESGTAEVRLQALRALDRLGQLEQVDTDRRVALKRDADPRVARFAADL